MVVLLWDGTQLAAIGASRYNPFVAVGHLPLWGPVAQVARARS